MYQFKSFHSINNITNTKFVNRVWQRDCIDSKWIVLEKIHGANFSIFTDGQEIKAARRNAFLAPEELSKFHNADKIIEENKTKILSLYKHLKKNTINIDPILILRGEIFGGKYYDEPSTCKSVQKGILYCPNINFIVFDINWNDEYLEWDLIDTLLEQYCFLYTKPLFSGSLKEAVKWSNDNKDKETTISKLFNLASHSENIREGHVIRPVRPIYTHLHEFITFKDKTEKFNEASKVKRIKNQLELSEVTINLAEQICKYITIPRLDNIFSKLFPEERDQFATRKNIKKIAGLMASDVISEYKSNNNFKCEDEEIKGLYKIVSNESIKFCVSQTAVAIVPTEKK